MARRRSARIAHDHRAGRLCRACHLYSTPEGRRRSEAQFEERYGARKGRYVYGAVVGKVAREREAKKTRYRLTYLGSGGSRQPLPLTYTAGRSKTRAAELKRMGYPGVRRERIARRRRR